MNQRSQIASLSAAAALALVLTQFGAIRFAPSDIAVRVLVPVTIAATPFVLWPYRRYLGIWVVYVGLLANLTVIVANGGLMPIQYSALTSAVGAERAATYQPGEWLAGSKDILVESGEGRVIVLGDSVVIHIGANGLVASPGDIVVWAGLALVAGQASIAWQRRTAARRRPTEQQQQSAEGGAATQA